MVISKLIEKLQHLLTEAEEDLEVCAKDWGDMAMLNTVSNAKVVRVKKHYNSVVDVSSLNHGGWGGGPKFTEPYQSTIKRRKTLRVVQII